MGEKRSDAELEARVERIVLKGLDFIEALLDGEASIEVCDHAAAPGSPDRFRTIRLSLDAHKEAAAALGSARASAAVAPRPAEDLPSADGADDDGFA